MERPLKILLLEDSEDDALLLLHELKRAGYQTVFERVDTREGLEAALVNKSWDVITADYAMPHFDGLTALSLLQEKGIDIPFIIVSGKIGEELAVEAMRNGARDYIMKGNLKRLAPTIEREIREAEIRCLKKQAEEALRIERERLGEVTNHANCALLLLDDDSKVIYANRLASEWFGPSEQLRGRHCQDILDLMDSEQECIALQAIYNEHHVNRDILIRTASGEKRFINISITPVKDGARKSKQATVMLIDITMRKQVEQLNKALNDINIAINSTLDPEEVMRRVINGSAKVLGAESSMILLREDNSWIVRYAYGDISGTLGVRFSESEVPLGASVARLKRVATRTSGVGSKQINSEMFRRYSVKSALAIPLIVRGDTNGIVYFNYHSEPVTFTDQQVDFAKKLAVSITLALENSRLYQAEHKIADTLQEALLTMPQEIEGIEFGYLYRSATETARVGGDFYDVFEIERGKVGIIIGDVSGKGITAAALTTVVRNTIKTHAYEGRTPATIISKTNDMVKKASPSNEFVTVFFAIIDLKTGKLSYCSAGHPPAIIKRCSGGIDLLTKQSPLVGAFLGLRYQSGRTTLKRGDTLILYTDGATEARCDRSFYGQMGLIEFIDGLSPMPAKDLPGAIFGDIMRYSGGKLSDDLALVTGSFKGDENA